jgi:ComF family protein
MSILKSLVNVVLPHICPLCGQPFLRYVHNGATGNKENGVSFCAACLEDVVFIHGPICLTCGLPFRSRAIEDHTCSLCEKKRNYFTLARGMGMYTGRLLEAIHLFKYGGKVNIGKILGRMLAHYHLDFAAYDVIMPVPLHIKRLRGRGFNQAVVLGREIARFHSIPIDISSLRRIRNTESQVNLNEPERVKNIKGAFEVKKGILKGLKTLLVDDIFTTGATVNECARVLKKAGADDVDVLTVAKVT